MVKDAVYLRFSNDEKLHKQPINNFPLKKKKTQPINHWDIKYEFHTKNGGNI